MARQHIGGSTPDELHVLQVGVEQLLGLPREGATEEERTLANTIARYGLAWSTCPEKSLAGGTQEVEVW